MSEDKPKPEKPQFSPSDAIADWPDWYLLYRPSPSQTTAKALRIYATTVTGR